MHAIRWLSALVARVERRRLDGEMDEEMALHMDLHAQALERQGLSPVEARRRAVAEFGGVQNYREEGRAARRLSWMHDVLADLRYGARALRRAPGFALVAALSLALGIGANTTIFGLLHAILLRRLPLPNAEQLVAVALELPDGTYTTFSRDTYTALRDVPGAPRLEAAGQIDNVAAATVNASEFVRLDYVEGGYHELLGVRPIFGRYLTSADDRDASLVAVISERVWERFFNRDPAVVGRPLTLNGQPFTVVGVLPEEFHGIVFNGRFDLAIPRTALTSLALPPSRAFVHIVGRREREIALGSTAALLDAAYRHCCAPNDQVTMSARIRLVDVSRGIPFSKTDFRPEYTRVLVLLMSGVFLVLIIACSNVGNLLLARAATRERELAIRLSIGASRGRVVRQLLAESALLAALGGVVGLALARWGTALLVASLPVGLETEAAMVRFRPSPAIFAFTAAASLLCVLAFGLGPALRATRGDLVAPLRDRAGTRAASTRGRAIDRALVIGQVAMALLLLTCAGLCLSTLRNLRTIDPGFASDHLMMVTVETRGTPFEREGIIPHYEPILDRLSHVPGVRSAAMATRISAYGGRNLTKMVSVLGDGRGEQHEVDITAITPGYFATAGTKVLGGREFDAGDTRTARPVVVVNEEFARRYVGGRSAVGRDIAVQSPNGAQTLAIVGIVQDVRFGDRRSRQDPMIYLPASQAGSWPFLAAMLRTSVDPHDVIASAQRAIASVAPRLRVRGWQTMDEAFDEVLLRERLAAGLGSLVAALALGLGMVGLAGVVGYGVARRTRDIGVRMALGAARADVVWLVLRGSLGMVLVGILIGIPLALGGARALGALLYGVAATDPLMLTASAAALVAAGALAAAMPAWRAARVDPVISLRAD